MSGLWSNYTQKREGIGNHFLFPFLQRRTKKMIELWTMKAAGNGTFIITLRLNDFESLVASYRNKDITDIVLNRL